MLSQSQKFNLHAIVVSLLVLIPNVVNIQPLAEYAAKIVDARKDEAQHLLPELQSHYQANCEPASKLPHLLVDQVSVKKFFLMTKRSNIIKLGIPS